MRFVEKLNTPIAVVVVLVLFLAIDGFLLYRYQQSLQYARDVSATQPDTKLANPPTAEPSAPQEQEPPTAGETTTSEGTTASPATTEEANKLRVDVRVVDASAWLRVQEDGQTVLDQESPPGFSRRFDAAREVRIQTGNAGATQVEANGRDIGPLGASGEVETWTFRLRPER